MTNSKRIGSGFERDISKRLSLWYSYDERDDIIWRSQSSGGRATVRNNQGKETHRQYGDLAPTHPMAEPLFDVFCFELKHGYDISILDLIDSKKKKPDLIKFIEHAQEQTLQAGALYYALIFQRHRHSECIAIPSTAIAALAPYIGDEPIETCTHISYGGELATIMKLDNFLNIVSPESIWKVQRMISNDTQW